MAYRTVQAARGIDWFSQAIALILKNPTPFLLMGLLLGVISAVPVLGGLALLVLGPAFYAGLMSAARRQAREGSADFQQLFDGFQQEGLLPKLLALCLPAVAAVFVLVVMAVVLIGGAMLGGGLSAASGSDAFAWAALGLGGVVFLLVALVVGFIAHALVFFAVPRVMFDAKEPFPAMGESWRAVLANIGAVLLFMVLVLVAYVVLFLVLGWLGVIGQVLITTVMMPLVPVAMWQAYRDVYGDITQETAAVAPVPPAAGQGPDEDAPPPPPAA